MSATEDDLQWLRNVNTRPGPDAGRSIDPSKPGPDEVQSDADRIAELEREIYTLRANLVECADTLSAQQFNQAQQKRIEACRIELAALIQSHAEPTPDDNFERHLEARISKLEHYMRVLQSWKHAEFAAKQSHAEPVAKQITELKRAITAKEREIKNHISDDPMSPLAGLTILEIQLRELKDRLALARSDAERELSNIAIAIGSNRFLDPPDGGDVSLAEQVKRMRKALEAAEAQSDAGPVAKPVTWMIFWEGKWEPTSEDEYERRSNDLHWKDRVIALYPSGLTAPPHPDASAGLIEAAEWHEAQKRKTMNPNRIMVHKLSAEHFRARAADRSGE